MENIGEVQPVDSMFALKGSTFPNEYVPPAWKELPEYGTMYARAIFYSSNKFGGYTFWNDSEFQSLTEISQGRQSITDLRKMFGFFDDKHSDAADDGSASLAYINPQVLNLAPKYINRAVAKVMNLEYDVQLEAIDPVSVHEKKNYEASIGAFYEFKKWLNDIKMSPRDFFPDLDLDVLPEYPDELMIEMMTNPKLQKCIDGENAIALIHQINDFNQKMRLCTNDRIVYGRGHLHCYRDQNGIPRADRINPKYYVGSYVENENFDDQEYAGFYDFPTITQFRKEARNTLSEEEIEFVIQKYANENNLQNYNNASRENSKYDGLNYIPVMRFYFLSQDDRTFVKRTNKFGNQTIMERTFAWSPDNEDKRFYPDGDSEVVKNSYTSVYGGTWVLDTNIVYDYGRKAYPRSNLVDVKLPVITFAPNYKDGRTVSFAAQMIEPLFMINVAWNKIKEILAKGWMGNREIDFTQLEAVAIGKGGKEWSPREVYKHFLQTNTLIKRSPINRHDQRYSGSAIENNPTGLELTHYFTALTTGINMLEQMTGTTVAEQVNTPNRLAVGVMEQSQATGDLDMEYQFNAHRYMFKAGSEQLLYLVQEAKRDGVGIQGFVAALGQHFTVPDSLASCDYGIFVTQAPGPQQWADFYQELLMGIEKGQISNFDAAYIREIKNLKKARQVLGIRMKINERKASQMMAANQQAQMQSNSQAASDKLQSDMSVLERKAQLDAQLIQLQAQVDEHLMVKEKELEAAIADKSDQTKKMIAKQTSVDEIIKKAVENKPKYAMAEARAEKESEPKPKK